MGETRQELVIVGGTSGIGRQLALLAAASNYHVWAVGRDPGKVEAAANIENVEMDAADPAASQGFFERVGAFDHLVLCLSSGQGAGPFRSLTEDSLRSGFEGKFFLHWRLAQQSLDFIANSGSITFISAASARARHGGVSGLAAINGAIEAMVRPLAAELQPIRVNAVAPGIVETPWWTSSSHEPRLEALKAMAASSPVRRPGTPVEVAKSVLFLIENEFITGSVVDCDGGLGLR